MADRKILRHFGVAKCRFFAGILHYDGASNSLWKEGIWHFDCVNFETNAE
jgi:hypothetical protein